MQAVTLLSKGPGFGAKKKAMFFGRGRVQKWCLQTEAAHFIFASADAICLMFPGHKQMGVVRWFSASWITKMSSCKPRSCRCCVLWQLVSPSFLLQAKGKQRQAIAFSLVSLLSFRCSAVCSK